MLSLIWLHFVADFLLQSHRMSINKSKDVRWLLWHCLVYASVFTFVYGWLFGAITLCLHFLIDLWSSRVTAKLWQAKEMHWFFCVIGFDQAVHITLLAITLGVVSI